MAARRPSATARQKRVLGQHHKLAPAPPSKRHSPRGFSWNRNWSDGPVNTIRALFILLPFLCSAEYTTFIGDANHYKIARVIADSAGNTYIAGTRLLDQSSDAFVMKLDAAGKTLLFRDISGKGNDSVTDLALDAAGNIYIGGSTSSVNFPVHLALQSTPGPGFLVKLNPDASQLVWSTYFPAAISAFAVDSNGNVYATGTTVDPKFPATPGLGNGILPGGLGGNYAAFLTKISAAGDRILYSALISGSAKDCGLGSSCFLSVRNTSGVSVAVDASGNAYLAGNTDTSNLPATPGVLLAQGTGAFVAKIKADGSKLAYLTYVGATHYPSPPSTNPANTATAIACDASGNAYLTGETSDPLFPATAGAFQTVYAGPPAQSFPPPPPDAFALKLNPAGSAVLWATYLGGSAVEAVNAIALDSSNQIWLAGTTASPEFPNAQGWSQGSDFIAGLDASGSKLLYAARYPNDGASRSVAVDSAGLLHISGPTGIVSTIAPAGPPTPRIFGVANGANGPIDGRIAFGEVISIYGPHIGPTTPVVTIPDVSGNLPTSVPGYQIISNLPYPVPLPILYASDSQINAVNPFRRGATSSIHVITPSGATQDFPLTVVPAVPQIFRNSDNSAIATNQDGTLNSAASPAPVGSTVSVWATGVGPPDVGYIPWHIASAAENYYCCRMVVSTGANTAAPVTYSGAAPGAVFGVTQINFQIPYVFVATNPYALGVQVTASDGTESLPVTLYIHN
jgi:uncharacterized protein (TIGR03437 family)